MKQINQSHVFNCIYRMYRNLYRRFLLCTAFAIVFTTLSAQPKNIDGTWAGTIFRNSDSSAVEVLFTFKNNQLINIYDETKTQRWFDKAKVIQQQDGESIIFWWTYSCEFGIQSKVYKITPNATGNATITWWKHNIDYSKVASTNDKWEIAGSGFLRKDPPKDLIAIQK